MTISSTSRKAGPFTGDGVTTAFPFSFKVFSAADLLVVQAVTGTGVESTKTLTTDYTVALNADQNATPGGTLTMLAAPPVGSTLTFTSQVANTQSTDLTNAGGFYPKVINDALDRATIQIQQLAEKQSRVLQLPLSSNANPTLPTPVASNLLGWDGTGQKVVNYAGFSGVPVSAAMTPVVAAAQLIDATSLLAFQQSGTGAVVRSVMSKLRERVSVLDFGAVADCTNYGAGTDNLAAFNACITYANANGYDVAIPPGRYRLSGAVVVNNTAQAGSSFQDFRCSIVGAGPRQSELWFDNGNFNGLTLNGTASGTGATSFQRVEGLALLKSDRQGIALALNQHSHVRVDRVHGMGWNFGHYGVDILSSLYADCVFQYNNYGALWQRGTLSYPNAITLVNCTLGLNANYGLSVEVPSTFNMNGGSVESNGSGGTDANKWGARIVTNATTPDGVVAATFSSVYFENNIGLAASALGGADLWIINNAAHAATTVVGCSFGRHANFALNCIRYESSGGFKNKLTLVGNGFRSFADYTPSSGRPYVGIGSPADTIQVSDLGNTYVDAAEVPDFSYPYVTPQSVASAWCRFDGTVAGPTITPAQSQNVGSVTKNGTGDYTINYRRALSTAGNCYDHTIIGGAGVLQVFSEATGNVRVKTTNLSGTATDFQLCVGVKGGMNFV